MKAGFALVLLSQAIAHVSASYYGYCGGDQCARQLTANLGYGESGRRRADCTKYLHKTIAKGTSTKWAKKTSKKTKYKTVHKAKTIIIGKVKTVTHGTVSTKTVGATATKTTTITKYTTIPSTITVRTTIPTTVKEGVTTFTSKPPVVTATNLKRDLDAIAAFQERAVEMEQEVEERDLELTSEPESIEERDFSPVEGRDIFARGNGYPGYLNCCNAGQYTSACQCWGIQRATKTVCAKTITKSHWVYSTSTCTRYSTSTCTKYSTRTNTKTICSSTKTVTKYGTITKTATKTIRTTKLTTTTIRATSTKTVPASTKTVIFCPSGYTDCSGSCVNLLTNKSNCGTCGNKCRTFCQAGACAGCVATTSTCTDGGGHLCDEGSTCICTINKEGQRACVVSSGCQGAICSKSSDCPSGWTCIPGTCCGNDPVCMRTPEGCPNGTSTQVIFKRAPKGTISQKRAMVPEFDASWKLKMAKMAKKDVI
ncbi:hypothetical protein ABW20_dc0110424 [Dactylellina cionopaga]|nr:hypothetical protein ABW20_dc0110424 [Dactylellina cionopaga]